VLFEDGDLETVSEEVRGAGYAGQTTADDGYLATGMLEGSLCPRPRRRERPGDEGLDKEVDDGKEEADEAVGKEVLVEVRGTGELSFGDETGVGQAGMVVLGLVDALSLLRVFLGGRSRLALARLAAFRLALGLHRSLILIRRVEGSHTCHPPLRGWRGAGRPGEVDRAGEVGDERGPPSSRDVSGLGCHASGGMFCAATLAYDMATSRVGEDAREEEKAMTFSSRANHWRRGLALSTRTSDVTGCSRRTLTLVRLAPAPKTGSRRVRR
jgi:hypothetical protein